MRYQVKFARAALLLTVLCGSVALAARGPGGGASSSKLVRALDNSALVEILSGVDFVPSPGDFDAILGENALDDLIAIAKDSSVDAGVRIRAYRALSHYPGVAAEEALADAIDKYSVLEEEDGTTIALASTGVDTILLRSAMDSLAAIAGANAVDRIGDMLDHHSRDVRAAAARALAVTGSADALPYLFKRRDIEEVMQVRLAIEEAIRLLSGEDQGGS